MSHDPTPLAFRDAGEGWHLRRHRLLLARGLAVLLALLAVGGAWRLLGTGEVGAGLYLVALAVVLALQVVPRGERADRPARLVGTPEGHGLLLPSRPASVPAIVAAAGGALLAWLLPLTVAALTGPGPGRGTPALLAEVLGTAVCVFAGLLLGLSAAAGVRSRAATERGVLLTPHAVVLRTRRPPLAFPWAEVQQVRAHWTRARGRSDVLRTPDDLVQNWLTVETSGAAVAPSPLRALSRQQHPTVEVRELGLDPDVALAVCRHYLDHPERRQQLTSEESLALVARIEGDARA